MAGTVGGPALGRSEADRLIAEFATWSADQRVEDAAEARRRERWLRLQDREASTLVGILVDLAERAATVTVDVGGHQVAGELVGVGIDAAVVRDRRGAAVVVALPHLGALAVAGPRPPTGGREVVETGSWQLRSVLDAFGAEALPVRIAPVGAASVTGDLVAVGDDVCTLRVDHGSVVYVRLAAVATLTGA